MSRQRSGSTGQVTRQWGNALQVAQARQADEAATRVAALEASLAHAKQDAERAVAQCEELADSVMAAEDALKVPPCAAALLLLGCGPPMC